MNGERERVKKRFAVEERRGNLPASIERSSAKEEWGAPPSSSSERAVPLHALDHPDQDILLPLVTPFHRQSFRSSAFGSRRFAMPRSEGKDGSKSFAIERF